MSVSLIEVKLDDVYRTEEGVFLNTAVPKTASEGCYILNPSAVDKHGQASFSFVRKGNELMRVPIVGIQPSKEVYNEHRPDRRDFAYMLCGFDIASKLVQMRNWPSWPTEFICFYVILAEGFAVGIVAVV